jgi:hypothetical protein
MSLSSPRQTRNTSANIGKSQGQWPSCCAATLSQGSSIKRHASSTRQRHQRYPFPNSRLTTKAQSTEMPVEKLAELVALTP